MLQNPKNPTGIDLIMANKPKCFQNSNTVETRLSDFHKITTTILKFYFKKKKSKSIIYRKYKNYNTMFREEFLSKLKDLLPNDNSLKVYSTKIRLSNTKVCQWY